MRIIRSIYSVVCGFSVKSSTPDKQARPCKHKTGAGESFEIEPKASPSLYISHNSRSGVHIHKERTTQ